MTQGLDQSLLGGVLRIDVDRRGGDVSTPIRRQPRNGVTENYFIPTDNPWYGRPESLEEFWALGFRNPFRMWIDPSTGLIWLGDVGWERWEEQNVVASGDNGQWPYREGPASTVHRKAEPVLGREIEPLYAYRQTAVDRAALGGMIYRGSAYPTLYGLYVFADNNSGVLRVLNPQDTGVPPVVLTIAPQFGQQAPSPTSGNTDSPTGQVTMASVNQKYVTVCARCHGEDGRGMPELVASEGLPARPDLTSSEWQQAASDQRVRTAILDGGAAAGLGPHMPAWRGFLSDEEVTLMIRKIRAFGDR